MTEQQQAWPIDKIEPHPTNQAWWRVQLKGYEFYVTRTTDELVAAGITPPRPPIVVTSGERSIELDPDDVAEAVKVWSLSRGESACGRVAVALANLLASQEPT